MQDFFTGISLILAIPAIAFGLFLNFLVGYFCLSYIGVFKNSDKVRLHQIIISTIVGFIILFLIIEVYTSIFPYKGEPYIRK